MEDVPFYLLVDFSSYYYVVYCFIVVCAAPQVLENGAAYEKSIYLHGEVAEVKCAPGYTLEGYALIICQDTGVFTETTAVCKQLPGL